MMQYLITTIKVWWTECW